MRNANYCRVLFVTGFADNLSHAELVGRFEEYGTIVSTRMCLPQDPEGYAHAFVEFAVSKDATAARLRLHQSIIKGHKLEVHFETKIPPVFNQMLKEAIDSAPSAPRRSYGEERAPSGDYPSRVSPTIIENRLGMSNERPQQNIHHSSSNARSPSYNDRRYENRMDESRSHTRNRYSSAQGYQGSRRYPEDRVARSPVRDRYGSRAPGASRPYNRPQGGRGGYGSRPAYRGGGGRNTNRSGFFERGGRGIEEHHSQDQQDPQDKYDHYRPQSAIHNDDQQGWIADDPVRADSGQLSPRNSRSRSISVERNANSGWLRSPSPVNGKAKMDVANNISNREGTNSFNEDSLFAAP